MLSFKVQIWLWLFDDCCILYYTRSLSQCQKKHVSSAEEGEFVPLMPEPHPNSMSTFSLPHDVHFDEAFLWVAVASFFLAWLLICCMYIYSIPFNDALFSELMRAFHAS